MEHLSASMLLKECSPFDKACRKRAMATALTPASAKRKKLKKPKFEKGPALLKETAVVERKPLPRDVEFKVTREGQTVTLFKGELIGTLSKEALSEMRKLRGDKPLTQSEVEAIQKKFPTKIKGG